MNFLMQRRDYACIFMHSYYYLYTNSSVMFPCPRVLLFKKFPCSMPVSYHDTCAALLRFTVISYTVNMASGIELLHRTKRGQRNFQKAKDVT